MTLWIELKRRNVVRVAAAYAVASWLLIEMASLAFDAFEAPSWTIKVFITFVALGFPLALFLAWAFELTPDGIKRERDVDRSQSITPQTGRKLDVVIIAILAAVIGLLLVDKFVLQPSSTPVELIAHQAAERPRSIAVLPFVNMSGDEENEYFADGISEELLNLLVTIDGLRVPSRTSSFAFKGKNMPISDIARELNVAHVLEGSVRKAGNRVRVTAQLIDVASDTHLWSDTYDRELEDIFAIQDDISTQIVAQLQIALSGEGPERATPTRNMQAHELYLKGLFLFRNRSGPELMEAVGQLEQAVALDGDFAQAWEALAMVYLVLPGYTSPEQTWTMTPDQMRARAQLNAERALQLNPGLVEARAVQALVIAQSDRIKAFELFDVLVRDHPESSTSRLWYGIELLTAGYVEAARQQFDTAVRIDPVSGVIQSYMATALMASGQTEDALIHARRAIDLGRRFSHSMVAEHALRTGDLLAFRDAMHQMYPNGIARRAADYIAENGDDRSDQPALVAELLADEGGRVGRGTGAAFFWLGEADPYFDRLPHDVEANLGAYMETLWYPHGRQFRQHPRFQVVAVELGLVKLWRQRGWPDMCRPISAGFECD